MGVGQTGAPHPHLTGDPPPNKGVQPTAYSVRSASASGSG
jgi:hypothetical protein